MTALRTRSVKAGRRRLIELAAFGFGLGLSLSLSPLLRPAAPAPSPGDPAAVSAVDRDAGEDPAVDRDGGEDPAVDRDAGEDPAVDRDAGEDSRRSGRRTRRSAATPAPARVATTTAGGGTTAISGIVAEPTKISMPSIDTAVPLVRLGLKRDGTMQVPKDYQTAGWYLGAAKPGTPGRAVIAGHVDSYTGPAAFYRLGELKRGDEIRISRSDGSKAVFEVIRLEQHPKDEFPTDRVYGPDREPLLRLVTCGGTFDESDRRYLDNVIVFARAVSGAAEEARPARTHGSARRG